MKKGPPRTTGSKPAGRSIHEAMLLLGQSALASPDSAQAWTREHTELVEALEKHDTDRAEQLARSQISAAFKVRLAKMLAEFATGGRGQV
jgi:DNA-binding GntR family transcriptional regulator